MPSTFNKPNLKAPRHHRKNLNVLDVQFFQGMRKAHPQLKKYSDTKLREVIWESNVQLYKDVIEHRDGVELPEFLGYLFIGSCPKPYYENINKKVTMDLGQTIEHRNYESDGFIAKIFYTNYETKYQFKFHDLWGFKSCRNFSREVAKTYPGNWKKYIQVAHMLKISRLFRKEKRRIALNIKTEILLEQYDEFAGF